MAEDNVVLYMPVWRYAFSFHGTQYSTDFSSCLIPNNQQRDVSCSAQVKIDLPVGKYMSFTMTTESSTSENERWITEDFWTGKMHTNKGFCSA
jgi:hypothetical protein